MAVVKYSTIIDSIVVETMKSRHMVRTVLKEISQVIQDYIEEGVGVEVQGLFDIKYSLPKTKGVLYKNKVKSWEDIVTEVYRRVNHNVRYTYLDVKLVADVYILRLKSLVEIGKSITLKGVGYIYVKEDDEGVYLDCRISPSLEKSDNSVFIVIEKEPVFRKIGRDGILLSMTISDTIEVPSKVNNS